jgi:hypothetical protein
MMKESKTYKLSVRFDVPAWRSPVCELTPTPACSHTLVYSYSYPDGDTNDVGICFVFGDIIKGKCKVALLMFCTTHQSHSLVDHRSGHT